MRFSSPRNRSSSSVLIDLLSLDQDRNHSTSIQLECAMTQDPQNGRNLPRVRSDRNKGLLLTRAEEDLSQGLRTSNILRTTRFRHHTIPQLVLLGEALLNRPRGEQVMNIATTAPVVTSVDADSLPEKLLDSRLEFRAPLGQMQARECQVGSLQGASQGTNVVVIGSVDALVVNLFLPESVCAQGLGNTILCERGIGPGCRTIAV